MDPTSVWLTVAGMTLAAYANRASFIALAGRMVLPSRVRRALRYAPVAVLTALVTPAYVMPAGALDLSLSNHRLLAGLIAIGIAWRFRSVILTIACGMALLHGFDYLAREWLS